MSRLRPTLHDARPGTPCPDTFDALYMIRDSVERQPGLIWGALRDNGGVCAIGAYFDDNPKTALSNDLIDQVAAYNDSIPKAVSKSERKRRVLEWLTARLEYMRTGLGARARMRKT